MMNTAILFDLDGTLLDTAPDFSNAMMHLRNEHGLLPLPEENKEQLRLAITHGVQELLSVGISEISASPSERHPLHERYVELYHTVISEQTVFFPGIEHLLQTLDQLNIPWGIVTNKPTRQTQSLLNSLKISERAKVIVCGDTTPFAKPHPEPLLYAAKILQLNPKQCLFIGDAERDIIAGRSAGMTTIAALFGYVGNHKEAKETWQADHYVTTAHEILPWIHASWLPRIQQHD